MNPDNGSTRGSIVDMLFKCVFQATAPGANNSTLTDVTDSDTAMLWAIGKGIIKGFPDGTVKAGSQLSRQEVFVIIGRFLSIYNPLPSSDESEDENPSFDDIDDVADWAFEDISLLAKYDLIRGTASDGSLLVMPGKDITDGELMTFIARLLNADY